jgi:hypothetical protein
MICAVSLVAIFLLVYMKFLDCVDVGVVWIDLGFCYDIGCVYENDYDHEFDFDYTYGQKFDFDFDYDGDAGDAGDYFYHTVKIDFFFYVALYCLKDDA